MAKKDFRAKFFTYFSLHVLATQHFIFALVRVLALINGLLWLTWLRIGMAWQMENILSLGRVPYIWLLFPSWLWFLLCCHTWVLTHRCALGLVCCPVWTDSPCWVCLLLYSAKGSSLSNVTSPFGESTYRAVSALSEDVCWHLLCCPLHLSLGGIKPLMTNFSEPKFELKYLNK